MDRLDRTDVDAARGLLRDEYGGFVVEFASHHDLLEVSAGEGSDGRARGGDLHPEACDQPLGVLHQALATQQAVLEQGGGAVVTHREVRRRIGGGRGSDTVAVFRYVGHPGVASLEHTGSRDIGVTDDHGAIGGAAHAHDGLGELGLSVAGDSRDADDLALVNGQAHVVDGGTVSVPRHRHIPQAQNRRTRRVDRRGGAQVDVATDHMPGDLIG